MKTKSPLFLRHRNRLFRPVPGSDTQVELVQEFPSINAAKRESVRLQKQHGGLGAGAVAIIRK